MTRKNILFICGSLNQTTMMYKISRYLNDHNHAFTPFYTDGVLRLLHKRNFLDFTIMGGQFRAQTENFLLEKNVEIDYAASCGDYDLVLTCSDLIVPKNIRNKPIILVQEGMTDPENLMYYLVKYLKLPRYLASTSTTGLSHCYQKFCVASEGYRDLFIKKGVDPRKLVVTGIPNFDNVKQYCNNDFPYKNFVLVATSDARETLKIDNRKRFLRKAKSIADGRRMIFRLHPNENVARATSEIKEICPDAMVYSSGKTEEMIANCDVLITQYSSVVYVGIALGKEVHSYFDLEMLQKMTPLQNDGRSAENIAKVCRQVLKSSFTFPKRRGHISLFKQPVVAR